MRAGEDSVTVAGWCNLGNGGTWTSATFTVASSTLSVAPASLPGPVVLRLDDIVGLDQLDDDTTSGDLSVLEFTVSSGARLHARVPTTFVDELVALLQRSREDAGDGESVVDDPPPPPARSGSKSALATEVQQLREYLDGLGFTERQALRSDLESLRAHRAEVLAEVRAANRARREEEVALVRVRRESVLQDAGIYRQRHPATDDDALRDRLAEVHASIDRLIEADDAVTATDDWAINGSRTEGRRTVLELAQLLLRTYNAEADLLVSTIRPYQLDAAIDRLNVTLATIHRLGASMEIHVSDELHRLRVEELTLAADHAARRDGARRLARAAGGANLYVASNRGAFGDAIVRIGLTAADDPDAVVDEIDGGVLPFRSDLHALVPCLDPDAALAAVRAALDGRRVNLADPSCSYFAATPAEVRDVLRAAGADVAWFVVDAVAEEWRQSENARHGHTG